MPRTKTAVMALLLLGGWHTASAQVAYHDLKSPGRFELPNYSVDPNRTDEIYLENSKRYQIYEFPRDPALPTWHKGISLEDTLKPGDPYLVFEGCWDLIPVGSVNCPTGARGREFINISDRVELAVDQWSKGVETQEVKFDTRRYVSFDLYIDPISEKPQNWTLIHQVWQLNGGSPPFAIYLKPSGFPDGKRPTVTLMFVVRNDFENITMHELVVNKGEWHRFTMQLMPSLHSTGQVAMWHNKPATGNRPNAIYRGPWGISTAPNEWDVRVGIYRRQQPRKLKVAFDNLRFGPTASSVE